MVILFKLSFFKKKLGFALTETTLVLRSYGHLSKVLFLGGIT